MGNDLSPMNFERIYEYRFRGIETSKKAGAWAQIAPWVWKAMGRPQRILDPACGMMEFLSYVPAAEKVGVDLMDPPPTVDLQGITFQKGNIFSIPLPNNTFDGVFISNFLEHLHSPEDIQNLARIALDSLKPGGTIAVMGPNFKYCMDEYFDCADHRLILTEIAVSEHLYAAGFELERVIPKFLPYSFRGKLPAAPWMVGLYLKIPLAWHFLGKQFLVIAKKA